MKEQIQGVEYIENQLKDEHSDKIVFANILFFAMIELRKISIERGLKIDEIAVKDIVNHFKQN
jgi:hypothetical protein